MKNRFINILNTKHKKNGVLFLLIVVLAIGMLGGLVGCTTGNAESSADATVTPIEGTGPFVGYVQDATTDTFDVYTEEGGIYIMSLPYLVFEQFPASERTYENWEPGWMNVNIYCGTIDAFTWAVVSSGPSAGSGTANVCTSADDGETWWVGDVSAMHGGNVTGAGFASSEVGFMSYRYYALSEPEISRTLDGGKTWELMTVDVPDYLKEYTFTPLSPTFDGESGNYPIQLFSEAQFIGIAYLITEDGGMTWQWKDNALN